MPESQNIEWKETWRDEYLKWISGFANANGGQIYIGKNDKGEIVGLNNSKRLMDDLPNKIKSNLGILCEVNLIEKENREYIKISIEAFSDPISYKGKFYYRSGSTNQLLNGVDLKNFLLKGLNIIWEEEIEKSASINDINFDTVENFKKFAIQSDRIPFVKTETDIESILKNLDLLDNDGKYKRASVLLFGKKPQEFVFSAFIKIGRFGSSSTELLSQDIIEGNAFELAEKTIEVLNNKYILRKIDYEGTRRIELPEYPFDAIREALFNAIIHRIYENTPITISVYSNRVTIWNQGTLNENLSIDDLTKNHPSYPRNKLLANIFYKAGFIESWGRGTLKIIEECKKYNLPTPKIELTNGGFSITLYNGKINHYSLKLNERQQKVIPYLEENGFITNKIYRELFNITNTTAYRDFEELVKFKVFKKEGKGRTSKYVFNYDVK